MKVSVIMPAFNAVEFIGAAIASCLAINEVQEIVVIEDGSTDNTLEVIRSFSNSKIKICQHSNGDNHGRSASRNLGIQNVQSEWIIFCDADDVLCPNRISHLSELSHDGIDGYYDRVDVFFEKEINASKFDFPELVPTEIHTDDLLDYLISNREKSIGLMGLTIRRSALLAIDLFDTTLNIGEDTDLIWRLLMTGHILKFGGAHHPVAKRRVHSKNTYQDANLLNTGRLVFYRKWNHLLDQLHVSPAAKKRITTSLKYYQRVKIAKKTKSLFHL